MHKNEGVLFRLDGNCFPEGGLSCVIVCFLVDCIVLAGRLVRGFAFLDLL